MQNRVAFVFWVAELGVKLKLEIQIYHLTRPYPLLGVEIVHELLAIIKQFSRFDLSQISNLPK